ncbi:MAG: hypothetical protein ABSG81_16205, partial [Acidimicrobiales bacterium]
MILALSGILTVALGAFETTASAANSTVTYSSVVTVPAPPSSSFPGASGGGDGWGLAITSTQIFNVFHHQPDLRVECHNQSDASQCWSTGPKTITDTSGNGYGTPPQPGLWIDQATGHLFVFATRSSDGTAGVVCIDTSAPATDADPFCGFTALSGVGQSPLYDGISTVTDPVIVGSNWYAFDVVDGTPTGTQDKLLCFNLTTQAACASQPFAVAIGSGSVSSGEYPTPSIAAIAGQIIIPAAVSGADELACFNPAKAGGTCAGSWPVATNDIGTGAPFPLLNASGTATGFCMPLGSDPCFSLTGSTTPTPTGLTSALIVNSPWDGPAVVLGPRVYVPNGNVNAVDCFDYSANAVCANFPVALSNLSLLYSVTLDPDRPTCIWVNSDSGADQIQNLDGYSGKPCGQGPVRVLASVAVAPGSACAPATWSSLQVLAPARSSYTSATVQFDDDDGNPIPGTTTVSLNATGSADLAGMNLSTQAGTLPQFLITFTGAPADLSQVEVKLVWTGSDASQCSPATGISLAPPTATQKTGSNDTLTATAQNNGSPAVGATVTFHDASGPNAGKTLTGTTNASGQATATYTSATTGTDSWVASFVDTEKQTQTSNTATVVWGNPQQSTTLTTSLSGGGTSGTAITVAPSTAVTDASTLTGTDAATSTGTVTYDVYSNVACSTAVSSG